MDNHHLAVSLPADRLTRVLNLLRKLEAELPFLIMLSDEERDAMPILDERKLAYIDRALHLVEAHPDFMPRDFEADEFGTDVKLVKALGLIHSHLLPLARKLDELEKSVAVLDADTRRQFEELRSVVFALAVPPVVRRRGLTAKAYIRCRRYAIPE